MTDILLIILASAVITLIAAFIAERWSNKNKKAKLEEELNNVRDQLQKVINQKKSSEILTGQISEKLVPFLDGFEHNPQDIQFLGQPIDYIAFEKNKITFIEVKSGNAQLTVKQRKIRDLILDGKVEWEVFRIK